MNNKEARYFIGGSRGSRPAVIAFLYLSVGLFAISTTALAQDGVVPMQQHTEAEELVQRIHEGMKKVDENLMDAKARGVSETIEENIRNIEKLLEDTRKQSDQVISDLDELIKSIKYQQCNSGGSGSPPPPDLSNSEKQPENQPRSEQEDQGLQKHDTPQDKDSEKDEKPGEARPEDSPGAKNQGKTPPSGKDSEKADHVDVSGRWGVLPPKIQNDILNFNIESFPEKYRKWLEEYYKRINRQKKNR